MKLDDIKVMANTDMKISEFDLDDESLKAAVLHQKYLNILTDEIITLKRCEDELKKVYRSKWLYYTGRADKKTYDEKGEFPYKLEKNDLTMFIESDEDYQALKQRLDIQKEKVGYLDAIIKQINGRHWQIRNAIEWRKFTQWQSVD